MSTFGRGRVERVELSRLVAPIDGHVVMVDRWWVVDEDGAYFYRPVNSRSRRPQCNRDRSIAESIATKLYPGSHVELIHLAYVPQEQP